MLFFVPPRRTIARLSLDLCAGIERKSFTESKFQNNFKEMPIQDRNRRKFLKTLAGVTAASAMPLQSVLASRQRDLAFYHTHTRKKLSIVYAINDEYVAPALHRINEFLADFRTGGIKRIDPRLLDLIYDIRELLGSKGTYEVISAYRSPDTNEMLRARSGGVAKKSQHLLGNAIDVRLSDVKTSALRDAALTMKRGGVGYYKDSDFVHIDIGRVRRW